VRKRETEGVDGERKEEREGDRDKQGRREGGR
jgi:hypothetical protein